MVRFNKDNFAVVKAPIYIYSNIIKDFRYTCPVLLYKNPTDRERQLVNKDFF